MRLIGVEAGGTKFVCVLGNEKGEVQDHVHIPTTTPDITLKAVVQFIEKHQGHALIDAIGIGAFGPIDPDTHSKTYGFITSTPKPGWRDCNIIGTIASHFKLPIGFDTDVNAAALGEHYWGNGRDCRHLIYLTVGTGIGGGVILEGSLQHGMMHTEMGHILIPHDRKKDPFEGICPYHHDCLEGLASGPAIKTRWHVDSALDLPEDHKAWDLESDYLAYAMANYILCFSPERIILGGGVMKQKQLLAKIHEKTVKFLGGYIENKSVWNIQETIVLAALGQEAGNIGALALAKQALERKPNL